MTISMIFEPRRLNSCSELIKSHRGLHAKWLWYHLKNKLRCATWLVHRAFIMLLRIYCWGQMNQQYISCGSDLLTKAKPMWIHNRELRAQAQQRAHKLQTHFIDLLILFCPPLCLVCSSALKQTLKKCKHSSTIADTTHGIYWRSFFFF